MADQTKETSIISPIKNVLSSELILPVVPIREGVLFPSTESVLTFGRNSSIAAIKQSRFTRNRVLLITQKDAQVEEPKPEDLYTIGTLAVVERTLSADGQVNALVRGSGRIKVLNYIKTSPYLTASVETLNDVYTPSDESKALVKHLQKTFRKAVNLGKPVEFLNFMKLMSGIDDGELVDQIASTLSLETEDKQKILETLDVLERIKKVVDALNKELKILEIEKEVAGKTQEKFEKHMRENVLRERMRTIQKELGEIDDEEEVVDEYFSKLKSLKVSKEIRQKVEREIKRLRQMSVNNPEAGYIRTWLDTIFELPWNKFSKDNLNIAKASKVLDKNHFGLSDVKDRILEYMAVLEMKSQSESLEKTQRKLPTILCFVGPPGVGKTSIGKSVAAALNRKFVKVSLGGVKDEAEIRGHRRTYVGAMPGRIINGIKQAGTANPVFMLDEIDKVGNDFRGDPSAALLEALDPEQNYHFEDHYLDAAFDLSEVIFITTANTLDTIPPALRDRLEIIRYAGYTQEEKFHIAKKHLLDKLTEANGLKKKQVVIPDSVLKVIIDRYTREAGVRSLERQINTVLRKATRKILAENVSPIKIDQSLLREFLGPEDFDPPLAESKDQVGVATGLAWTEVGGDILFIEVALTPGKGVVQLTGKLGDVMKESAHAALTYVKANAKDLGIDIEVMNKTDVHIHVPEGAVPKDGPSAGITMATAVVSAFTDRPVKREVAMTGEITLRGRVLRIGGLKEKSIAAHQAGCKLVLIPKDNERDLSKIPETIKKGLKFQPVSHLQEVIDLALKSK